MPSQKKRSNKKEKSSTQHQKVIPRLDDEEFLNQLPDLEKQEFIDFNQTVQKIKKMTWDDVYKTSTKNPKNKRGLNWEYIDLKNTMGDKLHTIRVTKKHRALVFRRAEEMHFVSLHPDHDSAYNK